MILPNQNIGIDDDTSLSIHVAGDMTKFEREMSVLHSHYNLYCIQINVLPLNVSLRIREPKIQFLIFLTVFNPNLRN